MCAACCEDESSKDGSATAAPAGPAGASGPATSHTAWSVLRNHLSSPMTLMMVASVGYGLYNSMGTSDSSNAVLIFSLMGIGMYGGAKLVSFLENSEWRKALRARVEAMERAQGIKPPSAEERATAAFFMGIPGQAAVGASCPEPEKKDQ
eukprot:CAMPEP_0168389536 /NCGR_PEP_ID=MMETSP0228-20121227/17013_1 /TAXON_ID=133427 /ORGANISM="Protoceratium reticulatum, Strain CCCM 535 (=CCMP 1889)" /LENGTH=149 /DNA_ID=CAMNT_0008402809 /DNA_START=53 /DNA_END=502 /DNA_ORIENTATION=-